MAKENEKKSSRDKLLERLKGRNPELDIDDDEAVSGQITSDYDQMEQKDEERRQFNDMLAKNPYAAPIVTGLVTGKNEDGSDFNLGEWLIDNEPEMVMDFIEGNPKNKQKYAELREQRRKDADEDEAFRKSAEELTKKVDKELDAAVEELGLKPEDAREAAEWLFGEGGFLDRLQKLELTKEDFINVFRLKNYDSDIENADHNGYVRGQNEKIDMTKHLRKKNSLPVIGGGSGKPSKKDDDETMNRLKDMAGVYQ
mgnify:CR=1 FL=1